MALRRYNRVQTIGINRQYGTSRVSQTIINGINSGIIKYTEDFVREGERLDTIAGRVYKGRSDLYWVIAAASKIGWSLQVPPNTKIKIPNLADVIKLIG